MMNIQALSESVSLYDFFLSLWDKYCKMMFTVYDWLPGADNALMGMVYIVVFSNIFFGVPLSKIAGARNIYDWKYVRINWPSMYYFCMLLGMLLVMFVAIPYILWRYPDTTLFF